MQLDFMTPDVWDGLILGVVMIGLALAVLRLYSDLSRPISKPPRRKNPYNNGENDYPEDTHKETKA